MDKQLIIMSTDQEIIDAVRELNAEIYDRSKLEYVGFKANTDGMTFGVEFVGICIWNDDDDERAFDEEKNEYEPLVPFLRRRAIEEILKLSSIWEKTKIMDAAPKAIKSGTTPIGVPCSAGLEELESAPQVLIRYAGRDGGYSPYYDRWQTILHGLGKPIASKRRDSSNAEASHGEKNL